jgi:hypothetical protein
MAKKQIEPIIINVSRGKLQVCGVGRYEPVEMGITSDMVADMVIVSQEKINTAVAGFIKQNNFQAGPIVMILSADVCFETEIPLEKRNELTQEMQKFLDAVPMVNVSSKVYEGEKGFRVVAISRDFYEGFRRALESLNFKIQAVVPSYVLETVGVKNNFDATACQLVFKHLEVILGQGFELEAKKEETFAVARSKFLNRNKLWVVAFFILSVGGCVVAAMVVLGPVWGRIF